MEVGFWRDWRQQVFFLKKKENLQKKSKKTDLCYWLPGWSHVSLCKHINCHTPLCVIELHCGKCGVTQVAIKQNTSTTRRSSKGFQFWQNLSHLSSTLPVSFHWDQHQQITKIGIRRKVKSGILPHWACHLGLGGRNRGSRRPSPPEQRQQTHLSGADSTEPDTAALHSSAQLSVVRFFPSGSPPASVPSKLCVGSAW